MSYFPKSKINILETSEGEFTYVSSGKPYNGFYIELSNGTYYVGKNPRNLSEEITKSQPLSNNFDKAKQTKKHIILKNSIFQRLNKTKQIPILKNIPTEKDYERGNYPRYFIRRINQLFGYKEVPKEVYLAIINQEPIYDYNMYITDYIQWDLTNNPIKTNKLVIEKSERKHPNISILFPLLTEFQRIVQINLETKGKEYYFKDGTEYIGEYHLHPTKGAMVGANHIKESHANLFKFNELSLNTRIKIKPESDISLKFRDDYDSGEEAERIDEGRDGGSTGRPSGGSSTPSSGGGGVSSGGGGGY